MRTHYLLLLTAVHLLAVEPENLLPEGDMRAYFGGLRMAGWELPPGSANWKTDLLRVFEEDGRRFLRMQYRGAVHAIKPIDPARTPHLRLAYEVRITHFVPGSAPGEVPAVAVAFLSPEGKGITEQLFEEKAATDWAPRRHELTVPSGAVRVEIRLIDQASAGNIDWAAMTLQAVP